MGNDFRSTLKLVYQTRAGHVPSRDSN